MQRSLCLALTLLAVNLWAADPPTKIGTAAATNYFQKTITVTGTVAQVTIAEKLVYLNLDQPYPNTPFTDVIFARATNRFGDLTKLQGKTVELTGRIEDYKGKLQIVLNSTNQLTVVDTPKPTTP